MELSILSELACHTIDFIISDDNNIKSYIIKPLYKYH